MIIGLIIAFIAGCIFGGIVSLHSAKMRALDKSIDDEFRAAQKSLEAKMAGSKPTPPVEPPKP